MRLLFRCYIYLTFLNLFIGEAVYVCLCLLTNLQANQVLEEKPNMYYANIFQDNPVDTDEMRTSIDRIWKLPLGQLEYVMSN